MNGPAKVNSLSAISKTSESVTSFSTVSSGFSDVEYKSEGNTAISAPRGSNKLGSNAQHSVVQHSQPSKSKHEDTFEERDARIDSAWNPRASVAFKDTIGLLNPHGENNCFLNSAIQVLWHLDAFRRNFRVLSGHGCLQDSCIFCALKVIFTQFQFSERQALPPDALRLALAESFADQHRFQLGQMDDAAECFETILERIHFHLAWNVQEDTCQIAYCLPHQKFAMFLVEQLVCECGKTSEPFIFNQIVYYVSTTAIESCLRAYKISGISDTSFGVLLFDAKNFGENRPCPSNCGEIAETRQTLANTPEVLTIGFAWNSDRPGRNHIRKILRAISLDLRPSELVYSVADDSWGKLTVAKLVGLVCYQGKHYSTFIFHSKLKTWVLFDDDRVREIGPEWNELVELCILGNYQPLLLLYSDPKGVPIDALTAPVNNISLCDEALNASGNQRRSRNDADAKTDLCSNHSQVECDSDSVALSHLANDESRYFDRTIEGVTYAGFHATSESVPHDGNCFDKLSQSSRKSRTGGIGESRTVEHSGIHDAYRSSASLDSEEKLRRLSCRESEFESDEFVDSDAASEKSQTRLRDENRRRTDQTRYASDRDRSAGCPDGRSLCPADRNEDDQTYMGRNTLDARNLRELEVNRYSQDTLDLSSEHLRMVGEENLPSVAENRRSVKQDKVFGRATGETEPIFNTAYGRKSAVEDRFSSVKVKPRPERRSCACAPEASEKYASNITVRQNRFSSASVINPLRADHSVRPYAVSSSLGIAFPAESGASVGRRTLPDRTVTCTTTSASSSSNNPSTDTVASNSAAFLRSKKVEHCDEGTGENYGSAGGEYHDPARNPQNTSRKTVHRISRRDKADAASWNFTNSNRNQFDKSLDITGGSDFYQNPIQDGVQTDCFSSDHNDRQLFSECIKLMKQYDEFFELSCRELEKGNIIASTEHFKDASRLLVKVGHCCRLDCSLEQLFQVRLRNFKEIRQEIEHCHASSLDEYKLNCQTEPSNGRQQERPLTVKNSRAEWDENMNKNSEPLPTGSDRGSVFCLSGHRKLDRRGDLKTGECGFSEGAANSGISSQSREDALGSRYRSSQPAVNRTCDADLAQKIIGSPCRSFPGVSSSRCSSANDDQCSVNRNQNLNKVSAPAFSSASSLPRHRTLSVSHGGTGSIRCEDRRVDSRKSQLTMSRLQGKERDRTPWKY